MTKRCSEQVQEALESRMDDIARMHKAGYWTEDDDVPEELREELPGLANYGLCINKVEAETFEDQSKPYIRYQLSWGGPSEEFRLYEDGTLEFWFLDWFDGASVEVLGEDKGIIEEIIEMSEVGFED